MTKSNLPSATRLVLIPSYNTGPVLRPTVEAVLKEWQPVWVVIEGSTDGSHDSLRDLSTREPQLRVIVLSANRGKGGATLAGMEEAQRAGFSHALVMDADGQHPSGSVPHFMRLSEDNPKAIIAGKPEFPADAPFSRRYGRCAGNAWAQIETLGRGIKDSLFGFRVYPIRPSVDILQSISGGRGYDFDTQLAVRLCWMGLPKIEVKVPVRYFARSEGGVSHFRYYRDNLLLIKMHIKLVLSMPWRICGLVRGQS